MYFKQAFQTSRHFSNFDNKPTAPQPSFLLRPTPSPMANNFTNTMPALQKQTNNKVANSISELPNISTKASRPQTSQPRVTQSLNNLDSDLKGKTAAINISTLEDIMTSGKTSSEFRKSIPIKAPQKIKKQFFYNTIYDIRDIVDPFEAKIRKLEKIHQQKAEDMLWNTPVPAMMNNIIESCGRADPEGTVGQYLRYTKEKIQTKKAQRNSMRPSTSGIRRNNPRHNSVRDFFKSDEDQDRVEILSILETPMRNELNISEINGMPQIAHAKSDYVPSMDNINTLLHSTRHTDGIRSLNNCEEFNLDSEKDVEEEPFEKWEDKSVKQEKNSEHEEDKETSEPKVLELSLNEDEALECEEQPRKVQFASSPSHCSARSPKEFAKTVGPKSTFKIVFDPLATTQQTLKSKPGTVYSMKQRPSTTGRVPSAQSQKRISLREDLINKVNKLASQGHLVLEGKRAAPEFMAYIENKAPFPGSVEETKKNVTREVSSFIKDQNDGNQSPMSPGNWMLQGRMMSSKMNQESKLKKELNIFHRKGHMPQVRVRSQPRRNTVLASRPKSGVEAAKRRSMIRLDTLESNEKNSPKEMLNAWNAEDNGLPSFRMNRSEYQLEQLALAKHQSLRSESIFKNS